MNFKEKKAGLQEIYRLHETEAEEFKALAVCKAGCAFCCTDVGNVDITTLEGLVIRDRIASLAKPMAKQLKKRIEKNSAKREKGASARCPFLLKNDTCSIYDIRPFSCRRLYSLKTCTREGASVHKESVVLAKETVSKLQMLDDTGYSGHMGFILRLLDRQEFRKLYLAGGFDPTRIMAFAKPLGILINRSMAQGGINRIRTSP